MSNNTGNIAGMIGRGLVAGLAGTLAITAAQMIEEKYLGFSHGNTPTKGVEEVMDIEPKDKDAENRLSQLTHFSYGTSWGAFRGALYALGVRGTNASVLHSIALSTAAAIMLPKLKLAPPPTKQSLRGLALDSLNHALYAFVVGCVYDALEKQTAD